MGGSEDVRIAILGAGPGGICMAIKLLQAGIDDFVILEKGSGVGGTWYLNRYPGCECDIPSHLYSYSFELNPNWSKPYAPQPEILEYIRFCVDKYGVEPYCRFDDGVRSAEWDEDDARWTLTLESGAQRRAQIVVSAIGMFNDLVYPQVDGLESFAGTSFHSARWNWDHDLSGERVGVIGSAASAIQFVPKIAPQAAQLTMFQRTANWVLPKEDDPFTQEELAQLRADPEALRAKREEIYEGIDSPLALGDESGHAELENVGRAALEQVEDPVTRAKMTPDHPWGCKRPLFANDYYPTFNRPNVEVVSDEIVRITERGVVTADGKEREFDTLIFATGFDATKYLSALDVRGRGGVHIEEAWADGAQAYKGVVTSGFPNLFMLYGPNTNNGSLITMIEYEVDHALGQIQRIEREGLAWIDVKPEPMAAYNEEIQKGISQVKPWQGFCNTYYSSASGRIVTQYPYAMSHFNEELSSLDPEAFDSE